MTTAYCFHRFAEFIEDISILFFLTIAALGAWELFERITNRSPPRFK